MEKSSSVGYLDDENIIKILQLEQKRQDLLVNHKDMLIEKLRYFVQETPYVDFINTRAKKFIDKRRIVLKLKYFNDIFSSVESSVEALEDYVRIHIVDKFTKWMVDEVHQDVDLHRIMVDIRNAHKDIKLMNFMTGTVFAIKISLEDNEIVITYVQ